MPLWEEGSEGGRKEGIWEGTNKITKEERKDGKKKRKWTEVGKIIINKYIINKSKQTF